MFVLSLIAILGYFIRRDSIADLQGPRDDDEEAEKDDQKQKSLIKRTR